MDMLLGILVTMIIIVGGGLFGIWITKDSDSKGEVNTDDFYYGPDPTDDFDD